MFTSILILLVIAQSANSSPTGTLSTRAERFVVDHNQDGRGVVAAGSCSKFAVAIGSVERPWNPADWVEVSDSVRGGSSRARMSLLYPSTPSQGVRFEGLLDAKALGGAGFASQAYRHKLELPGDRYVAFFVELLPIPPKSRFLHRFSLTALNSIPRGGFGAKPEASISYEYDFEVPTAQTHDQSGSALQESIRITAPFEDFKATYRGRAKPDAAPFDPHRITQIAFMCRSFFNEQAGPFELTIIRVGVVEKSTDCSAQPTTGLSEKP